MRHTFKCGDGLTLREGECQPWPIDFMFPATEMYFIRTRYCVANFYAAWKAGFFYGHNASFEITEVKELDGAFTRYTSISSGPVPPLLDDAREIDHPQMISTFTVETVDQ